MGKIIFWSSLFEKLLAEPKMWLLYRELNKVLDESEKLGGRSIWKKQLYLKNFLHEINGIDLGFIKRKYTSENKHHSNSLIKERLDKVIVSRD